MNQKRKQEGKRKMINLIYTILPIISFIIGFSFGFTIKIDEKLPEIKILTQIIKKKEEEKKAEQKKKALDQCLENIDNYPYNQKYIRSK